MFRQVLVEARKLAGYPPPIQPQQSASALPSTGGSNEASQPNKQKEHKDKPALIDTAKEATQPAPCTTTVVMGQLGNQETVLDELLPPPLLELILRYFDVDVPEGYETALTFTSTSPLFLSKLLEVYTREMAHQLLWHLRIHKPEALTEILESLKKHPACLTNVVEIKDPYGQRVKNTILNILQSAGDRDPCKMTPGTHYGLVELLKKHCFEESMLDEYKRQVAEWDATAHAAAAVTMARYEEAYQTLCAEIIQGKKDIPDVVANAEAFERLFDLPIVKAFIKKLKPDPDHVVKSGPLFSFGILLKFFKHWEKKVRALGGWGSVKCDLFVIIVYLALQARVQRIDLEVFKKGIENVNNGQVPDRIDYTNGVPGHVCGITAQELKDHGLRWYFGIFGDHYDAILDRVGRGVAARIDVSIKQKHQRLD